MQSLLHTSKAYSPSDGLMDPMRCCHQVRRSTPLHYDIYSRFLSLTEGFTNCVTSWGVRVGECYTKMIIPNAFEIWPCRLVEFKVKSPIVRKARGCEELRYGMI